MNDTRNIAGAAYASDLIRFPELHAQQADELESGAHGGLLHREHAWDAVFS